MKKLLEALDNDKEGKKMSDSKTLKNLMEAFAGESQANRKYTAYAQKADKEGKRMRQNFLELQLMRRPFML